MFIEIEVVYRKPQQVANLWKERVIRNKIFKAQEEEQ
jgi:hypothetical protein